VIGALFERNYSILIIEKPFQKLKGEDESKPPIDLDFVVT
jgi:hypothetical protein